MGKKRHQFDSIKYTLNRLEAILEISCFCVLYFFVWTRYYANTYVNPFYFRGRVLLIIAYAITMLMFFNLTDSLKYGYLKLSAVSISQSLSIVLCNIITYFQLSLLHGNVVPPKWIVYLTGLEIILGFLFVYVFTRVYHAFYVPRNMLLVYSSEKSASCLRSKLDTRSDKYRVSAMINIAAGCESIISELDKYDAVLFDEIPADSRSIILEYCYHNEISTYMVPEIQDIFTRGMRDISLFDTPLLHLRSDLTLFQRVVKRTSDIIFSLIILIVFSPVMVFVALLIKLSDGGPVFYKQIRLTKGGQEFRIIKFRSMKTNSESDGVARLASRNDNRITPIGKIIRACRIDELPQMINILKGDMSLVGPRPERPEIAEKYIKDGIPYDLRLRVKAGLTGYAQIIGKYNTTPYDKLKLDLIYIENYSLLMDVRLFFMTPRILLMKDSTEGVDETFV